MKYDATEKELEFIEWGQVDSNSNGGYIYYSGGTITTYITISGEMKTASEFTGSDPYHKDIAIAEKYFEKWKESKEIKIEKKVLPKKVVKRMNTEDFSSALKEL